MKKIFTLFVTVLLASGMYAGSFGILVNGKVYYAGTLVDEFEGFTQYLAHVQVSAGDYCQLYDADNKAAWAVALNTYSEPGFTYDAGNQCYNVTVTGCYDFYIKLKYQQDELYIGNGSDCGSGQNIDGGDPGTDPGSDPNPIEPGEVDDVNFYAIGWINGADHGETAYDEFDDTYLFQDGKLAINCTMGSYIAIKDHNGNFYYSRTETTIANTSVQMDWANGWPGGQKWAIPEGVNYIIILSAQAKGSIVMERVDKATFDAYHINNDHEAVENTAVTEKARKVMIDGQLRIVRGDKVFDATGREL
jgi:hypothetical protein